MADLADAEQMRSLVSELNALRITEFIPGDADPAVLGLDRPEYRVVLETVDDSPPVVLELVAPAAEGDPIVVRRDGKDAFRVSDGIRTRLGKAPVLWRSAKVWPFSSWGVSKVEIASGDDEIVMDRVDGLWQLSGGGETDGAEVRRRLNALADLEAREHDLMLPPTEVMGSVILVLDNAELGAEGVTYTFHAPIEEGGHAAVTVSSRANVMGVDAAVAETVLSDLDGLRPAPQGLVEEEGAPEPE